MLGGWTNSLTFVAQTGNPFSMNTSITTSAGSGAHPYKIASPFATGGSPDPQAASFTCPTKVRTTTNWYNPCSFRNPPILTGNQAVTGLAALPYLGAARNTVYGPGYERINGSLFKNFTFFREANFQLRADYFNLLNTPAYGNPNANIGSNGGQITGSRSLGQFYPDSRFFQFAGKINF